MKKAAAHVVVEPMTRKDDPDLVTSGPYKLVRHLIYSGILVTGLGSAVGRTGRG